MDLGQAWEQEKDGILKKQQGQGDLPAASPAPPRGVNMAADKGGRPKDDRVSIGSYSDGGEKGYDVPVVDHAQRELDSRFTDPFKHDPRAPKRRGRVGAKNYDPIANKWF